MIIIQSYISNTNIQHFTNNCFESGQFSKKYSVNLSGNLPIPLPQKQL
jgi:hypothetical protein